jgi:hypothetical protein
MNRVAIICRNIDLEYLVINRSIPIVVVKDTVKGAVSHWMKTNGITGELIGKVTDINERELCTGKQYTLSVVLCLDCRSKNGLDWIPYHKMVDIVYGYSWIGYIQGGGTVTELHISHHVELQCTDISEIENGLGYCNGLLTSRSLTAKAKINLIEHIAILTRRMKQELHRPF